MGIETPHAWRMANKSMGSERGFHATSIFKWWIFEPCLITRGIRRVYANINGVVQWKILGKPSKRSGFDPDFSLPHRFQELTTNQDRSSQTSLRNNVHFSGNLRPQKIELVLEFHNSNPSVCKMFKPPDFQSVQCPKIPTMRSHQDRFRLVSNSKNC